MCATPSCEVVTAETERFCEDCKRDFSVRSLELMVDLNVNPNQLLATSAKRFDNAQSMADYLGISLPTLYAWIQRYTGLNFGQFKQKFMCRGRKCIVVDYSVAGYAWKYTMTDRIRALPRGCVCFLRGSDELMMTTLDPEQLAVALSAEPIVDNAGIHHLRYPLRLPIYTPSPADDDDD